MKMKKILTIILVVSSFVAVADYAYASDMTSSSSLTDKKPSKRKGEVKEVTLAVHLHCENCVKKVEENIAFERGVKDLKVSLEDQTVYIKFDSAKTSVETLKKAIEVLGYPVAGELNPGEKVEHHHDHHGHNH